MALGKKTKVALGSGCGCLIMALFGFCGLSWAITDSSTEEIEQARAACGEPHRFLLREGGNEYTPADWECMSPEDIAAHERAAEEDRQRAAEVARAQAETPVAPAPEAAPSLDPDVESKVQSLANVGEALPAIVLAASELSVALEGAASTPAELSTLRADVASALDGLPATPGEAPTEPVDPPAVSPPEYAGAVRIRGRYRGPYDGGFLGRDGVVVESGSTYYVVLGAQAGSAFTSRMNGYGTPTGRTITLAIGRDGRPAGVYDYADRETYNDDQRAHREDVSAARSAAAEARTAYREARSGYRQAVRDHDAASREWDRALGARRDAIAALPQAASQALGAIRP